jgi:hypothetical protein
MKYLDILGTDGSKVYKLGSYKIIIRDFTLLIPSLKTKVFIQVANAVTVLQISMLVTYYSINGFNSCDFSEPWMRLFPVHSQNCICIEHVQIFHVIIP